MEFTQNFDVFLQENLSYTDYQNLPELLGESPRMVTQIKRHPEMAGLNHLSVILKLIKKRSPEIKAIDLIKEFALGENTITNDTKEMIIENHI